MNLSKFLRIFLIFFFITCSKSVLANNSIYFIDTNFLITNSLAGKSIISQLLEKKKILSKELNKTEIELKNFEKEILSQKKILSEDEINKKIIVFNKQLEDYKLKKNKMMNRLATTKNIAQKELNKSLVDILATYSEKESIEYIIHKRNIIIGKTELDLTNKILKILDSKVKKIDLK